MPLVPSSDLEALQFFETHISPWQGNAVAIGTTAAAVTNVDNKAKAARARYNEHQAAKAAARAATQAFYNAVRDLRSVGGDVIRQIRTQAEVNNNPAVYTLAQIPPPAAPTPQPPPGQPHDFAVSLTASGAIVLAWKSSNSAPSGGAYFSVRRRLPGEAGFSVVGGTGSRSFADDSIPPGVNSAVYIVQGFRGTTPGLESEQLGVQFGAGAGAGAATVRLAA